jgi:hypothetical protein
MTPTAKGVRTSEGQVTFLAILGAVIAALVQLPTVVQAVAIVSAAVVTVTYILSRTRVKTTAIGQTAAVPSSSTRRKGPSD